MSKKDLSERDICTKYITPAIEGAGWDIKRQVREEVSFTDGRIIVRGQQHTRGKKKRADYILYFKPNMPIAIVEAKDNKHSVDAYIIVKIDGIVTQLLIEWKFIEEPYHKNFFAGIRVNERQLELLDANAFKTIY